MSLPARTFEEAPSDRLVRSPLSFSASVKSSPREHYRPPPILLVEGKATTVLSSPNHFKVAAPSPALCANRAARPKQVTESLDSPAFMGGDLSFSTFRSRAARAIAEWGPSPTRPQFSESDPSSLNENHRPRPDSSESSHGLGQASNDIISLESSKSLLHPGFLRQSHAIFNSPPATPFTPLTPGPCNSPQHRETARSQRPPSLKVRKARPRPSPLQLSRASERNCGQNTDPDVVKQLRSVRFADGSPMRGSTWNLTQYPERLASPPISAANLTLDDLKELESIKQSLGTWCGEMMGSPMREASLHRSSYSGQDDSSRGSSGTSFKPTALLASPTSSDVDWQARWPMSPAFSDCDSEIFEGMH